MKLIHSKNYTTIKDNKALKAHKNGRGWLMRTLLYNISNYNYYGYHDEATGKIKVENIYVIANDESCIIVTYCNRQNWSSFDWYVDVFGDITETVIKKVYKIMEKLELSSIIAEPYHSENRCLIKITKASGSVNNWYIIKNGEIK